MIGITLGTMTAPCLAAGWYLAPMVMRRMQEQRLREVCVRTHTLCLTYDDGPGAELTPELLHVLERHNAKATFFLAGFRVVEHPDVVDAVRDAGHEIGCHGHDHINAWRTAPWDSARDVEHGYHTLERWIEGDGLYRPPFGKMTCMTWAALRKRHAPIGWWTHDAGDVCDVLPSPSDALNKVLRAGGGVVLMHDFDREPERGAYVLEMTDRLLHTARAEGWRVCPLGELMHDEVRSAA